MRPSQILKLKAAVESARTRPDSSFIEWIDDDESQHVVTDVVTREREAAPVAVLAGGGYVILTEADPCDFRLVMPAVPPDPLSDVNRVNTDDRPSDESGILLDWPTGTGQPIVLIATRTPDDPALTRCKDVCEKPADGKRVGACPKCGCLVLTITYDGSLRVHPARGTLPVLVAAEMVAETVGGPDDTDPHNPEGK